MICDPLWVDLAMATLPKRFACNAPAKLSSGPNVS